MLDKVLGAAHGYGEEHEQLLERVARVGLLLAPYDRGQHSYVPRVDPLVVESLHAQIESLEIDQHLVPDLSPIGEEKNHEEAAEDDNDCHSLPEEREDGADGDKNGQ